VNGALFVPKKLSFRVMVSKVRDRFRGLGLLLGLVLGLGSVVTVAYLALVLKISVISYGFNTSSG